MTSHTRQPSLPCPRFSWCAARTPDHTEHMSASVQLPEVEGMVLYIETGPDTGETVHGPILTGHIERPITEARPFAAQLRLAAARLDELAAWAEAS